MDIEEICENCEHDRGQDGCEICGYNTARCGEEARFFSASKQAFDRAYNQQLRNYNK